MVTLQDILNRKRSVTEVEVEGLGTVLIKPMNAAQIKVFNKVEDTVDMLATAVVFSMCDNDGNLIFPDANIDQLLENLKISEIGQIAQEVTKISGLHDPKK